MKLKAGVDQDNVQPVIWWALGFCDDIYRRLTPHDMVVTSLTDSTHMNNSFHYRGLAADIRTRDLTPVELLTVYTTIHDVLDPVGFDIIKESDHIHMEYDPKPGDKPWYTEVG